MDKQILKVDPNIENEHLADGIMHGHESLCDLENTFGRSFDVISVKRDRHERFISLWKHVIDEAYRINDFDAYEKFKKFTCEDLLSIDSNNLIGDSLLIHIKKLILENNIKSNNMDYIKNMLYILYKPTSHWHNHDSRIKWFDIKKLDELEHWVSDKIGKRFKMEKINSSQHFDSTLVLDDNFVKKYNQIYDRFDMPKNKNTLI